MACYQVPRWADVSSVIILYGSMIVALQPCLSRKVKVAATNQCHSGHCVTIELQKLWASLYYYHDSKQVVGAGACGIFDILQVHMKVCPCWLYV